MNAQYKNYVICDINNKCGGGRSKSVEYMYSIDAKLLSA